MQNLEDKDWQEVINFELIQKGGVDIDELIKEL